MEIIYQLNTHQISQLHVLYQSEWWTKGRTLEQTKQCVAGSQIIVGLVDSSGNLQGFTRVLTDYIFKALIFDVIVAQPHRGKGVGELLMNAIKQHPALSHVNSFELYCLPEMFEFYQKHGFSADVGDIQLMRLPVS
ncbi:GNAT family N-acetyltransferase [Catenovulum agarivorans]|uniref:GNAT family N-acetyltransferase n=1 Tax=Catenovulum agarivorans TaxID=1172192 RepID=UPI0002E3B0A3|nr:GNAT family N-acetyltransferase [Catenovulum agarivorans]